MSKFKIEMTAKLFIKEVLNFRERHQSVIGSEKLMTGTVFGLFGADVNLKDISKKIILTTITEEVESQIRKGAIQQLRIVATGQMLLPGQRIALQGPQAPKSTFIDGLETSHLKLTYVNILNYWTRKLADGEALEEKHRNAMIEQMEKNENAKIQIELAKSCIREINAADYNPETLTVEEAQKITKKESEKVPA